MRLRSIRTFALVFPCACLAHLAGCAVPQTVPDSTYDCTCSCALCDAYDAAGVCTAPHDVRFGAVACAPDGDLAGAGSACASACAAFPSDSGCTVAEGPTPRHGQACQASSGPRLMAVQSPMAIAAKVDPLSSAIYVTLSDGSGTTTTLDGDLALLGQDCASSSCPLVLTWLDFAVRASAVTPGHSQSDLHLINDGLLPGKIDAGDVFVLDPQVVSFAGYGTFDGLYSSGQGRPLGPLAGALDYSGRGLILNGNFHTADGLVQATLFLEAELVHRPPVAVAGPDQQVGCGAPVHLDGSASRAPDGTLAAFAWYTDFGAPEQKRIASGPTADVVLPPGTHPITLLVRDDQDGLATATTLATVADGAAPSLSCPAQLTLECDAGGAPAGYGVEAAGSCGGAQVSCTPAPGSRLPAGSSTPVTCTATDALGRSASCAFAVQVQDTLGPTVNLRAGAQGASAVLWPPDGALRGFDLGQCVSSAVDRCDGPLATGSAGRILRITSDEPDRSGRGVPWYHHLCRWFHVRPPGSDRSPDMVITGASTALLRAERDGGGDGRVYTVFFEVRDGRGNATASSCQVAVPHSSSQPAVAGSAASCVGTGCP